MIRLSLLSFAALATAFLTSTSALPVKRSKASCGTLYHPDFDCSKGLTCEAGRPSESGNYSGVPDPVVRARDNLSADLISLSRNLTLLSQRDEVDCCRPTYECWEGVMAMDEFIVEPDGTLVIEDVDNWKKAECCMRDFTEVKPWCLSPPKRTSMIEIMMPPLCSIELSK